MQNSRISELESLITKSSSTLMSPAKSAKVPGSPSSDTHKLKEEVRVLHEAIEVMEQQADEYQKEIRTLKDKTRTPRVSRQTPGRITPKKSSSVVDLETTLNQFGSATKTTGASSRDLMLESISLETALLRPALASATQSASYWKAKSMGSVLSKLAPLNVQPKHYTNKGFEEVVLARNEVRLAKASFSIAELSNDNMLCRKQLHELKQKERLAETRLHDATLLLVNKQTSEKGSVHSSDANQAVQCGRVSIPCREDTGFVTQLNVSTAELRCFHSSLVQ